MAVVCQIWEHENFGGLTFQVEGECPDLRYMLIDGQLVNMNDMVSSIRVSPGWAVTLCEDAHFGGDTITLGDDGQGEEVENLSDRVRGIAGLGGTWNDITSSIKMYWVGYNGDIDNPQPPHRPQ